MGGSGLRRDWAGAEVRALQAEENVRLDAGEVDPQHLLGTQLVEAVDDVLLAFLQVVQSLLQVFFLRLRELQLTSSHNHTTWIWSCWFRA